MKKATKRVLLIVGIVLLLAVGVALVLFYPMLSMSPAATGAIADTGISAVRNARNAVYFVDTGEGYILVDAGSNADSIQASLEEVGIAAEDVRWILITHSDYDHVAALPRFPNAEILMSEAELPLLDGRVKRNGSGGNDLPEGIGVDALTLVADGQELSLGGMAVTCVASPGHTIGSMSYLVDGRYLFTGDAFRVAGGAMQVHPFTMDEAQAAESIAELAGAANAAELVLTGHYGYYEGRALTH